MKIGKKRPLIVNSKESPEAFVKLIEDSPEERLNLLQQLQQLVPLQMTITDDGLKVTWVTEDRVEMRRLELSIERELRNQNDQLRNRIAILQTRLVFVVAIALLVLVAIGFSYLSIHR